MQKILYLIQAERHRDIFTGFMGRTGERIRTGLIRNPKIRKIFPFYSQRLDRLGIICAVENFRNTDGNGRRDLFQAVDRIIHREHISLVSSGEIDAPKLCIPCCDGKWWNFFCCMAKEECGGKLTKQSQIVLVLAEKEDEFLGKFLCDRFKYLIVYPLNKQRADEFAEKAYAYNGTGCIISANTTLLQSADYILSFNPNFKNMLKVPKYISLYENETQDTQEVYIDAVKKISLNASYKEARFFMQNGSPDFYWKMFNALKENISN